MTTNSALTSLSEEALIQIVYLHFKHYSNCCIVFTLLFLTESPHWQQSDFALETDLEPVAPAPPKFKLNQVIT